MKELSSLTLGPLPRGTIAGLAKLSKLEHLAAAYSVRPELRNLPTWWLWVAAILFGGRSPAQHPVERRRLMQAANRYYGIRFAGAVMVLAALALGAREAYGVHQAAAGVRARSSRPGRMCEWRSITARFAGLSPAR